MSHFLGWGAGRGQAGGGQGGWGEVGGGGGRACLTSRNFAQKSAT